MLYRNAPFKQQKGAVLVITALSLIVIMGMLALAIDLSHAYVNKTRLQNLADSLALSAAISLNKRETSASESDHEAYAEDYAKTNTFTAFMASSGNKEISDAIATGDLTFEFAVDWSDDPDDWEAAGDIEDARFARVSIDTMNVATWFAGLMGFEDIAVNATAVAGSAPILPCDDVLPVLLCTEEGNTDTDCSDGECYGYTANSAICLKDDSNKDDSRCPDVPEEYWGLTEGNFGWMDVDRGAAGLKECLAGNPECAAAFCEQLASDGTSTIDSNPGNIVSSEQGFNTRFDEYKGSYKDSATYPPDKIVGDQATSTADHNSTRTDGGDLSPAGTEVTIQSIDSGVTTDLYNHYKDIYDSTASDATHAYGDRRRIVAAPFIDCADIKSGKFTTEVKGIGCFFLTEPMGKTGQNNNIYVEMIDDDACLAAGTPTSTSNFGFYKVQLYKDPFGGHS